MDSAHTPGNVVVTGGAGFIGSHLCEALIEHGAAVTCVDDLVATGGSTRNVDHLLDVPGFDLVAEDVLGWAERADLGTVTCVFHQAASKNSVCRADPERDLLVNALGTLRLVRAAVRDGVPAFVHASTGSVAGDAASGRPVSYYGVSKLAGETYCEIVAGASELACTVLRYHHVIGPRQDSSDAGGVVPIFARRALAGLPLIVEGTGEQTRSFTSVHDIVRANLVVASAAAPGVRRISCASGVQVSINELAAYVNERTGNGGGITYAPPRPGDIAHFEVDAAPLLALGIDVDTNWRATVDAVIGSLAGLQAV